MDATQILTLGLGLERFIADGRDNTRFPSRPDTPKVHPAA